MSTTPTTPTPEPKKNDVVMPIAAYNLQGWNAGSCIFRLTKEEFEKGVLAIAKTYIDQFTECTYERGQNGHDALLLWIPSDSNHLINKKSTEGTILKRAIREYSPQFKEFVKKFCKDTPDGPPIRDSRYRYGELIMLDRYSNAGQNKSAIVVNPKIFIDILFDVSGVAYQKEFNKNRPVYTNVEVEMIYAKSEGRKYPRLTGLKVTKSVKSSNGGPLRTKNAVMYD